MRLPIFVLTAAFVLQPARPALGAEIEFLTAELPWAVADKGYSPPALEVRVSGRCPLGGVGYSLAGGTLPPGIQLSQLGYLSGVPLHTGTFDFSVHAADGCSWTARRFKIVVSGAPIFTLKPDHFEFQVEAGAPSPPEQVLHISATWPHLAYQIATYQVSTPAGQTASRTGQIAAPAETELDWLKATPEHGFTPREGSAMDEDRVSIRIDASHLKPGHYSAILKISAWQALPPSPLPVDLNVTSK